MNRSIIAGLIALIAAGLLSSCSTRETIPRVRLLPVASGWELGEFHAQGPRHLMGSRVNGPPEPPDIPSSTSAKIRRIQLPNDAHGYLQVVSIERPAAYNNGHFDAVINLWRNLTDRETPLGPADQEMLNQRKRPEIPWINAAKCFYAKLRVRRFRWGKAVMFLTTYVQGHTGAPVNNEDLVLVVQGFTKDGRYAVNAHIDIHHPKLPDKESDKPHAGKAYFAIDDDNENRKAERWLDAQADDSFELGIGQYEALLDALEIVPGR